ncbi:MAG: hypothetical protein G01um101449_493 [Parcubacteria group bacterium Gr01-1014_49]|nr:MAG: hypothetical protein G01um101449_493 [Parcubacteria group bacterium Gr01-1014_49]
MTIGVSTEKEGYLLSEVAVIHMKAVDGKPTEQCFTGPGWKRRGYDLCTTFGLSVTQPDTESCVISVLAPEKPSSFAEWIASLLFVDSMVDISSISSKIMEKGFSMTLPQGEVVADFIEKGAIKPKIHWDKRKIFFPLETGDPRCPVKMACIYRDEGKVETNPWDSFADYLGRITEWKPEESFLLIRNLKR